VDITIVLASGVDPDIVLGYSSRRRVRDAVVLLEVGKTDRLLMSGGKVDGADITAAEMMRNFAQALGAPPEAILIEDRSRTTFENLRFSAEIIEAEGAERVALLTDEMHLTRASLLAGFLDIEIDHLSATRGMTAEPMIRGVISVTREAMAWWYNIGKIAVWWILGLSGFSETERAEFVS
jgi:uncharacterized SAM-binding protein YcdF (DUF218 family)